MSARPFVRRRLESFKEHFWKIAQPSVKKPITASEPERCLFGASEETRERESSSSSRTLCRLSGDGDCESQQWPGLAR